MTNERTPIDMSPKSHERRLSPESTAFARTLARVLVKSRLTNPSNEQPEHAVVATAGMRKHPPASLLRSSNGPLGSAQTLQNELS